MEHITINVKNLEESIAFYEKYIGVDIVMDLRTNGMPIVFLGNEGEQTHIELVEEPAEAYNGSGISLGFSVDDVEAYRTYFEKEGLNPTPIISPNSKVKFFFIEDPNGLKIQILN